MHSDTYKTRQPHYTPSLPQLTFLRSLALESDALECSQLGAALRQLTLLTHLEV